MSNKTASCSVYLYIQNTSECEMDYKKDNENKVKFPGASRVLFLYKTLHKYRALLQSNNHERNFKKIKMLFE